MKQTKAKTRNKAKAEMKAKIKAKNKKVQIIKKGNLHILTRSRPREDKEREERIAMEVVVDAYGEAERAMGWYYYLEGKLSFPFIAKCVSTRAISPLRKGDEVEVIGMAPVEECKREIFANIPWEREPLAVPLSQLKPVVADEESQEAIGDWHYWVKRGYEF
jgi:Calcium binding